MGSRTKPNLGGSGHQVSRKPWAVNKPHHRYLEKHSPIKDLDDLERYLSTPLIFCLECGGEYKSLGQHLSLAHAISSREYKLKWNIPVSRGLSCKSLKEKKTEIMKQTWEDGKLDHVRPELKKRMKKLGGNKSAKTKATSQFIDRTRQCLYCKKDYTYPQKRQKYCSHECYVAHSKVNGVALARSKKGGAIRRLTAKRNELGVFI